MGITYSECVFIAPGIEHAMRRRRIVFRPARLDRIFPHYLINDRISKKKLYCTYVYFVHWFSL